MTHNPLSRRGFIGAATATAAAAALATTLPAGTARAATASATGAATAADGVALHWLDGAPAESTGSAWGVPWPRGQVAADSGFALADADGSGVPVQSWPLAYWPDGSLKWSGHAVPGSVRAERLTLHPGRTGTAPATAVTATVRGDRIVLANGTVTVELGTHGGTLIRSVRRGSRTTAQQGRLVLLLQDAPDDPEAAATPRRSSWTGVVEHAEVEQSGPVRAVVRLSGRYRQDRGSAQGAGGRAVLPWTLRLYLGAGDESVRLVHHFLWDADVEHDFVRGLGLELKVPMSDDPHNRHIRFGSSSGGVWGEPVRVLTGLRRDPGAAVRKAQVDGTATPPIAQWATTVSSEYTQLALWNDFTCFQETPNHFSVWKRTSASGSWLRHAGHGERASGFGYVGGVSGGLGFGLTDFWQRLPRSLDVRDAAGDTATATLWSWSPHGGAMDMRHYDTTAHGLDLAYEDVQTGFSTPQGMARSTEMTLWAFDATPARDRIAALGTTLTAAPQLVADPDWYHGAGVFGRWSLPDRSTPARAAREDALAADIAFYRKEVEQREWYGFWHYGDVMHTYDGDRHTWRYDVGGYAWDNAELGTDAMLWYAYLRSGDASAFRLARAMTQHVSETDTHHAGRFAGLGSRHNVIHWGDGAKEARVGESYTKRFAYYLTADERLGDLIRTSLQADETLKSIDPLREVLPAQTLYPARIRIGPDWYALVSNWLTEWERTGDTRYRDLITTGMADIAALPAGLFTGAAGGAVGFDPATGHVYNFNSGDYQGGYNLAMAFLGEQVLWEALDLVDAPAFRATLLDFARYVQAPNAEKQAHYGFTFNPQVFATIYSRVTAWAGEQLNDATIRARGWSQFNGDASGKPWPAPAQVSGTAVVEPVAEIAPAQAPNGGTATNDMAQRNLAYISLLAIAPAEAP